MRTQVFVGLLLLVGCTKDNLGGQCVPGVQQACACPGGVPGAQTCKDDGSGFGVCFGCPGDSADLSVAGGGGDLAVVVGGDLSGVSDDMAAGGGDMSAGGGDMSAGGGGDMTGGGGGDMKVAADMNTSDLKPIGSCPNVMVVLDRSGSMDTALPNSVVTRLQASVVAIEAAVANYGAHVPIGYTTFNTDFTGTCADGIDILDEPLLNNGTSLNAHIAATVAGGGTNTGDAVAKVVADVSVGPGSYIILVTDGEPNCQANEPTDTIIEISRAVGAGIKTYVVGLDPSTSTLVSNLNGFAAAGQTPCKSGFCAGNSFYPASSQAQLTQALDLILNDIIGKQTGGTCAGFACFPSGAACNGGKACCGTVGCVNLDNNAGNCGSCGNACPSGQCKSGQCVVTDMALASDMLTPPLGDLGLALCSCASMCPVTKLCVGPNCCLEGVLAGTCNASSSCNPQTYP